MVKNHLQSNIPHTNTRHYETTHQHLEDIKEEVIHNNLSLSNIGSSIYADTLPIPTYDIARDGWKHTKTAGVEKFNYYFYGNVAPNPILVPDLKTIWAVVSIDTYTNTQSLPFFVSYTLPTGVGDVAVWYKSKKTFTFNSSVKIYNGEKILMYVGEIPKHNRKLRKIKLENSTITGNYDNTETINLLTIHSDSGSDIDNSIIVHSVGWGNQYTDLNIKLSS